MSAEITVTDGPQSSSTRFWSLHDVCAYTVQCECQSRVHSMRRRRRGALCAYVTTAFGFFSTA